MCWILDFCWNYKKVAQLGVDIFYSCKIVFAFFIFLQFFKSRSVLFCLFNAIDMINFEVPQKLGEGSRLRWFQTQPFLCLQRFKTQLMSTSIDGKMYLQFVESLA